MTVAQQASALSMSPTYGERKRFKSMDDAAVFMASKAKQRDAWIERMFGS
jgi:hypothetical protein